MTSREALDRAYAALDPYSRRHHWEWKSNLVHLETVSKHIEKGATIFDAGCGIGILALALTLLGYQVKGGDKYVFLPDNDFSLDYEKLRDIWERYGLTIMNTDVLTDAGSKQYDAVVSVATIEHQKHPRQFLQRLIDMTRRGGHVYIATPNTAHLLNRIRFLFGYSPMAAHWDNYFKKGDAFEGHWREYTLAELVSMFTHLDLEVITAKNLQGLPTRWKKNFRNWYVNAIRLMSHLVRGARETNIILGKKR